MTADVYKEIVAFLWPCHILFNLISPDVKCSLSRLPITIQRTQTRTLTWFSPNRLILERWDNLCLSKSPCHGAAAHCLFSSNAAPHTTKSSLLTFCSFSLPLLYTLNFKSTPYPIRIQLLKPTFPPSGCRKLAPLQLHLVSGLHWPRCKAFPSNAER